MSHSKMILKITAAVILLIPVLIATPIARAEGSLLGTGKEAETNPTPTPTPSGDFWSTHQIVPTCATVRSTQSVPQLDCALQLLGNVAQLILSLTGGLALLMFVYGGFMILASAGSKDRFSKGTKILEAAVTGIVIILLAGYLVRYGLDRLGVASSFRSVQTSPIGNPTDGKTGEPNSGSSPSSIENPGGGS